MRSISFIYILHINWRKLVPAFIQDVSCNRFPHAIRSVQYTYTFNKMIQTSSNSNSLWCFLTLQFCIWFKWIQTWTKQINSIDFSCICMKISSIARREWICHLSFPLFIKFEKFLSKCLCAFGVITNCLRYSEQFKWVRFHCITICGVNDPCKCNTRRKHISTT